VVVVVVAIILVPVVTVVTAVQAEGEEALVVVAQIPVVMAVPEAEGKYESGHSRELVK